MKNIIVPFDFSETAYAAFETAVSIAYKHGAGIDLLYVIVDPFTYKSASYPTDVNYRSSNIRKFLEGIKKETFINLKNVISRSGVYKVKIQPYIETHSSVYQGILNFINKKKTGLIVMGTHGVSNIKTKFLGTNTERIFRMTKKPVLIIRSKPKTFEFKKIVFATNLEKEAKKVLNSAWAILKKYDARFDVLRVNTPKDSIRYSYAVGLMQNLTKNYDADFDFITVDAKSPEEGINSYCTKSKADLLVLGVHRRKGLNRLFTDRISEAITRVSAIPVLTIDIN
jgi:nucleotide-binding universal stress UspA family protein